MTISPFRFDGGEFTGLGIAAALLVIFIACYAPWARSMRRRQYEVPRVGLGIVMWGCLLLAVTIAPLMVVAAYNHYKTEQVFNQLTQQGFTVLDLSLTDAYADVIAGKGCYSRAYIISTVGADGKPQVTLLIQGGQFTNSQVVPCFGTLTPPGVRKLSGGWR